MSDDPAATMPLAALHGIRVTSASPARVTGTMEALVTRSQLVR